MAMMGERTRDPALPSTPSGSESMSPEAFVSCASSAARFVAQYSEGLRQRRVRPQVKPGYLRSLLPSRAPEEPEPWSAVLRDLEEAIIPGMVHWQSPQFHGFFPSGSSYATVLGEMVSAGLGVMGFTWASCPAATELETLVMDWLAQLMGLPESYLNAAPGPGGGVIQSSASESTLVALLVAKERTVKRILRESPGQDPALVRTRLVAYTCDQANSSVEKAGSHASVQMRLLPSDSEGRLRAEQLRRAVEEDRQKGLLPCFVVATTGSTPTCAFDPLEELGVFCKSEDLWLHVDAAYAGAALICPEFRHLVAGVHLADSFCVNPHKWMLVNFDCSAMWVKDSHELVQTFSVDRVYLTDQEDGLAPDYRHWSIPLGRRFRALKLWMVLRMHGAEGLRAHIRRHVALAQLFAQLARADERFEVVASAMGLVCFRLKGNESLTVALLDALATSGRIFMVAGAYGGQVCARFCVCSRFIEARDVQFAWEEVCARASEVLAAAATTQTPTLPLPCGPRVEMLLLPSPVETPSNA